MILKFFCVTLTVWLIMDVKVEAYKSGCSGGYCFVISDYNNNNERLAQSAAQQRCQLNGTQLVEIISRDIQNATINFIRSQGLTGWNVLTNGKRSSGNWIRLNGNIITGLNVYTQTDSSYAYGYLKSSSLGFDPFASRPTDNKGGYICTGLSDCSGGVTISGQCYRSFTETLSWYDARNRCLDAGGDLAAFDHITSNAGFSALNGSWINPRNSYWIGIRREWWAWQSTNSDVKYSEWITGHPLNEVNRENVNCLCLSTTEWKWTACGCNQQLPFVCISGQYSTTPPSDTRTTTTTTPTTTSITTSTTTRSTTSTIRSTSTAFTTKDASKATSRVASESNGVSMPTTPATVTSNSTSAANDTESLGQSIRLSREATIGIGVGVGVGGAVVIVALVAALVILCRKRCPLRCPRQKKTDSKALPPHGQTQDNDHSSGGMESLYASVVPSSPKHNNADTNALENSNETSTVYAQLGFHKEPSNHRDGSVIIVPGKTKPTPVPRPPATNGATKRCNVGDDINAGVTMA